MPIYQVISKIDNVPTFEKPIESILSDLNPGDAIETLNAEKAITRQQIAWWKGILLPALAADTGDSKEYWENVLKLVVMPDEFKPIPLAVRGYYITIIASITKLNSKKMNELIEGSVKHLRDAKVYGDQFQWVTLPDKSLRK